MYQPYDGGEYSGPNSILFDDTCLEQMNQYWIKLGNLKIDYDFSNSDWHC